MVVPVGQQAAEQIGAAQERAIAGRRSSKHEMVAASCSGMPPDQIKLVGPQTRGLGFFVNGFRVGHQVRPIFGGLKVHFDDARVGRDAEATHAVIDRRRVPFQHDRRS